MISLFILSACSNKALVENPTSDKIEEDSAKDSTNTSRNKQENSEITKGKEFNLGQKIEFSYFVITI